MFWALLAIGVIVALIGLPFGDDADTMDALSELTAFQANFDREELERDLLARASAQGEVRLADVARQGHGRGTPKLTRCDQGAPPVQPDASAWRSRRSRRSTRSAAPARRSRSDRVGRMRWRSRSAGGCRGRRAPQRSSSQASS